MKKSIYAASVLRYIHDQVTGEFVNVGLILVCSDRGFFDGFIASRTQRVTQFFPGVKGLSLRRSLKAVNGCLKGLVKSNAKKPKSHASRVLDDQSAAGECAYVMQLAHQVLAQDDSSLQWSEPFTGLTSDPTSTLNHLFDRLVRRYESDYSYQKRTDAQIWSVFSKELETRQLSSRIQEHDVSAKLETVTFKHALKNGRWHLLEPVSFDLTTPESIKDKAKRILGQMMVLKDSSADFQLHFLVGEPANADVREAYDIALKILAQVPVPSQIFPESQKAEFVKEITKIAALPH